MKSLLISEVQLDKKFAETAFETGIVSGAWCVGSLGLPTGAALSEGCESRRATTIKFIGIETICLLLRDGNNGRSDLAGEA
jgi:hypothetical protein